MALFLLLILPKPPSQSSKKSRTKMLPYKSLKEIVVVWCIAKLE